MSLTAKRKRPYPRYRHLQAEFVLKGLTQTEVARRIGITHVHLSAVLNGHDPMTDRLARDISRATKIPLTVILGDGKGA